MYTQPIRLDDNTLLKTYADLNGNRSPILTTSFRKKNPDIKINLNTDYYYQYSAGGTDALVDGITGGEDFRTGAWQGYLDEDVDAVVNLSQPKTIQDITVNSDQGPWIFFPKSVECYVSSDEKFQTHWLENFEIEQHDEPKLNPSYLTLENPLAIQKLLLKNWTRTRWHIEINAMAKVGYL